MSRFYRSLVEDKDHSSLQFQSQLSYEEVFRRLSPSMAACSYTPTVYQPLSFSQSQKG